MTLETGFLLNNRYQILEIIAKGGMGAIYKAKDTSLGVFTAVKENLFTTEEGSRQFRKEATILAGVRHPNLPRVTDHFVTAGQGQYLVMDYIDGEDLFASASANTNSNLLNLFPPNAIPVKSSRLTKIFGPPSC